MLTLYRSGGLTPFNKIANTNSLKFDNTARKLTNINPHRSTSVYTSVNLHETSTLWAEYRDYTLNLDSTIYSITLHPSAVEEEIYAYNINHYENFFNPYDHNGDDPEWHVVNYVNERVHIKDLETFFPYPSDDWTKEYEILIPYRVAQKAVWTPLTQKQINDIIVASRTPEFA